MIEPAIYDNESKSQESNGHGVDGGAGCAARRARPPSIPCHKINNADKISGKSGQDHVPTDLQKAWNSVAKGAVSLEANALAFVAQVGIEKVGFLTLTTPDHLSYWSREGWREGYRRYNNFRRRVFPEIFGENARWVRVIEPTKKGRIHWHLLIECPGDIRTGFDFEGIERRDYASASPLIRSLWAKLRKRCKAYGLGRSELLPIRKTGEAVSQYVGKYLAKGASAEWEAGLIAGNHRPKNGRRVGYSQGWRVATCNFAWVESGRLWRQALASYCGELGLTDSAPLADLFGPQWGYKLAPFIVERYLHEQQQNERESNANHVTD